MIQVIKANQRHHADHGWLSTYWHFSFSDYYDPDNMNWGALRVFNDDVIKGGGGFGMHPHRDMEIVTYVLEGELEHQDNLGNRGVIHTGEVEVNGMALAAGDQGRIADEPALSIVAKKPAEFMLLDLPEVQ